MSGKHYINANEFLHDSWKLAAMIRRSGWRPDYLVGLWRGGAPVAVAIHEFLEATGWSMQHIPLKCASYTDIGENAGEVVFTHEEIVLGLFRKGNRVLVIDDVFDTGKTAAAVKAKMEAVGVEMRLACVYWKPQKNTTNLKPDYFVKDVGSEWIVFPHEIDGLTPAEIAEKDPTLTSLLSTATA